MLSVINQNEKQEIQFKTEIILYRLWFTCLLYTSPSPRDLSTSRMPSSA